MEKSTNNQSNDGCGLLFLLIPLVVIGFFFLMTVINGVNAARLVNGHETIEASITISGMRREPSYYEFTINDEAYHGRSGQERKGQKISVAYLETNPAINRPVDGLYKDMLLAAGVPVLAIAGLIYIFFTDPKPLSDKLTTNCDGKASQQ